MRFMIIVKATAYTEKGIPIAESVKKHPEVFAAMATYHEDLAKAGALLDGSGLHPSSKGWRVMYSGNERTVIDGPFAEAKELVAGYTLIQVKSREEAMEWVRRFPNPSIDGTKGEIEVRQLFELDEFGDSPTEGRWLETYRGLDRSRKID
ncbi:MAG: YciI family protein [Candidatus Latescibacteria bacterium]|nr:YciI family protein [Candidatus Latescibacterota bacterium]